MINLSKQPSVENRHLVETVLPKKSSFFCGRSVPQDVRSQFLYYDKFCLSFDSLLSRQDHLAIQFSLLLTLFSCSLMYAMLLFRLFYSSHTALHCIAPLFFFWGVLRVYSSACFTLRRSSAPAYNAACCSSLSLSLSTLRRKPAALLVFFFYRASLPCFQSRPHLCLPPTRWLQGDVRRIRCRFLAPKVRRRPPSTRVKNGRPSCRRRGSTWPVEPSAHAAASS